MPARSLVYPPAMPTMVSRLPRFGSHPKSATTPDGAQTNSISSSEARTRFTNRFYHHPGTAGGHSRSTGPLSSVSMPTSFSGKWKKEKGMMEDGGSEELSRGNGGNNIYQNFYQRHQGSAVVPQRDAKKPTSSTGRAIHPSQPPPVSPSQSKPRTSSASRPSELPSRTNRTLNGPSGPKPQSRSNGSVRRPNSFVHPGSVSGSGSWSPLQNKPPASRSRSNDSLSTTSSTQLSDTDRSRSLTQVRQHPSHPRWVTQPSPTNRGSGGRAKESSASSVQAPPRGSLLKSPVRSRASEGGGGGSSSPASVSIPSLKKPLVASLGPASKPSGISYKLSRPSLFKQSHPVQEPPSVSGDLEVGPSTGEDCPGEPLRCLCFVV